MEAKVAEVTKERAVSKSYTVKSFGIAVKKLIETKLVDEKDGKTLKEIHTKVVKQFMGFDIFEK